MKLLCRENGRVFFNAQKYEEVPDNIKNNQYEHYTVPDSEGTCV